MATVVINGVTYSINHKPSCVWSRGSIGGNIIRPVPPNDEKKDGQS